jgi:hypothetical protein
MAKHDPQLPAHLNSNSTQLTIYYPSPVVIFLVAKHRQNFQPKGGFRVYAFLPTAGSTLSGTPQGKKGEGQYNSDV